MKLSLTPSDMKIQLTEIIDNNKGFKKSKNGPFQPLATRTLSKHSFNHLPPSKFLAGKQFSSIYH